VQIEGKKRMAARDFLLGTLVATGTQLGNAAPTSTSSSSENG
jgi:hypothetical protein